MAHNTWYMPKSLAKSKNLSFREKFVVTIALQYLNSGYPEKATEEAIEEASGMNKRTFNAAIRMLSEKDIAHFENNIVNLNHAKLIEEKLLSINNYTPSALLAPSVKK